MLSYITGPIWKYLAALGAAVVAVLAAYAGGRGAGRKGAENDAMRETINRVEKGRDAVRDGRGGDPAERLRKNDGKW